MAKTTDIIKLVDGAKGVTVEGKIVEKNETREVKSKYANETYKVATATLADATGSITINLWNDQINQYEVGDNLLIEYAYVTTFKGELQLNIGKYSKVSKIKWGNSP